MIEISPIETRRPFTRLLRVNWNSARSDRKPARPSDQNCQYDGDGVRQMRDVGQMPCGIRSDHHELPKGEVHDAGNAERQGDAKGNDAIKRPHDDAVEELPENDLGHRRLGSARGSRALVAVGRETNTPPLPGALARRERTRVNGADSVMSSANQGSTRVIWMAPPFFRCAISKSKICSPRWSYLIVHTPLCVKESSAARIFPTSSTVPAFCIAATSM